MPLVLAPLVALSLGGLLAIALPSDRSSEELRARRIGWLFALLSLAPNFAYFAFVSPDWSVAYFFRAGRLPSAALLVASVAVASMAPLAQHVGLAWVRGGAPRRALVGSFGAASLALVVAAAFAHRLWFVGTFEDFHGGGAMQALGTSLRGFEVLVFDALTAAGFVTALSRASLSPESALTSASRERTLPGWTTRSSQKRAPSSSSSART